MRAQTGLVGRHDLPALGPQPPEERARVLFVRSHRANDIAVHGQRDAKNVSYGVALLDGGVVVEAGAPQDVLVNPREERTKAFLVLA